VTQVAAAPSSALSWPVAVARRERRPRRLPAGWPLAALLCLYPLWWALGVGQFAFLVFAVPMAWELRRRRPLRMPPAFGAWMLFLLWFVFSLVMLPQNPSGTVPGSLSGRVISIGLRLVELGSASVTLLYVGNLPIREVSQRRLLRWLSTLFLVTLAGGLLGLFAPHFQFTSPLERLLPSSITSNYFASSLVHPTAAQVQNVLGYQSPRPAAPWSYTNYWANNLSILLVWFCVFMWHPARLRRRGVLIVALMVTTVVVVYSLNRGLWIGIIVSVLFVVAMAARGGDARATLAAVAMIPVIALAFFATPLHTIVGARVSHGESNGIRTFLDKAAVQGAFESPIIGWGGTRKALGSSQSIAVGPSPNCPTCGAITIGSTGEIWMVMFSQGLVGLVLYLGFFVGAWWRLRRDRTPIGAGARLVIWLALLYALFYNSVPVALTLVMISIGLSWRNLLTADAAAITHERPMARLAT
jgi:O-antigen ligase